jgi:hypothetical protein
VSTEAAVVAAADRGREADAQGIPDPPQQFPGHVSGGRAGWARVRGAALKKESEWTRASVGGA